MKGNVKVYRKRGKDNASKSIFIRLTQAEKKIVSKKAEKENLSISEFVRRKVFSNEEN